MNMKFVKIYISITAIFLNLNFAFSSERNINRENMQWVQYYTQTKINSNWSILADAGHRLRDNFSQNSQFIARAGIAYKLSANTQIAAGYAQLGYFETALETLEYRPYQELIIKDQFKYFDLKHRYRIEQRFFRSNVDNSSFNFRFRYSLMASIPIYTISEKNEREILLKLGNEIFLNSGEDIIFNYFDQNRFIISPTIKLNKDFAISFTYNHQFGSSSSANRFNLSNVFWLQINHNFNY